MHEINTEIYLKKKKIKRQTMEGVHDIICLNKRNKNYQKLSKKLHDCIHNKLVILLIFFLISLYTVLI